MCTVLTRMNGLISIILDVNLYACDKISKRSKERASEVSKPTDSRIFSGGWKKAPVHPITAARTLSPPPPAPTNSILPVHRATEWGQ